MIKRLYIIIKVLETLSVEYLGLLMFCILVSQSENDIECEIKRKL